mmetsp:Transcript_37082/g.90904  ORF Transcript_37082/g.90904 Transcript_37082/m.90904 type:complete len:120 (-) Transcript_37082:929-1288(-)
MVSTTIAVIVAIASYAGTVSDAVILPSKVAERNVVNCVKGFTLTDKELELKMFSGFSYCSDSNTSIELSENQCATVFDTASSMVDNTKLGGKCLTYEFAVRTVCAVCPFHPLVHLPVKW